jgi:HK97 gp10 family phage protein
MAGITVRVNKNSFPAIAKNLPVKGRVVTQRRGDQMVDIARNHSRVDTGAMRDGWKWTESNTGGRLHNEVEHTSFNEYGTRYMSAQPMARPAAEQVFPLIIEDFKDDKMYSP